MVSRADELRKRHEVKSQKMGIGGGGGRRTEVEGQKSPQKGTKRWVVGLLVAVLLGAGIWFFGVRGLDRALKPEVQEQALATGRTDLPDYITSVPSGAGQAVAPPRDGTVTIPTVEGGKGMVFQYRNGKLHGEQQVFAGHKRPLRIFHCVDGRMHGTDTFYDLKGKVRRVVLWENGASQGLARH